MKIVIIMVLYLLYLTIMAAFEKFENNDTLQDKKTKKNSNKKSVEVGNSEETTEDIIIESFRRQLEEKQELEKHARKTDEYVEQIQQMERGVEERALSKYIKDLPWMKNETMEEIQQNLANFPKERFDKLYNYTFNVELWDEFQNLITEYIYTYGLEKLDGDDKYITDSFMKIVELTDEKEKQEAIRLLKDGKSPEEAYELSTIERRF